ncbi:hypothetical protein JCM11641_001403 [Rhodosporidiobolus odoratus]
MASQTPTPSSEIIHLVSTFTDALDSLPPSLTRSLSDLKELDAVLNSSLQAITEKLKNLHQMMHTPDPTKSSSSSGTPQFTQLDRLKLLREVAEDARVFRLGGEDKIRVATNTCETISTHTSHLSTLSTLLLGFLPSHLLPGLPAPAAPHGFPKSNTTLRNKYDYSASRHAGQGSNARVNGALGLVREHYEVTGSGTRSARQAAASAAAGGGGAGRKRAAQLDYSIYGDDYGVGGSRCKGDKDPNQRHPNQYTKKRLQAAQAQAAQASGYGGAGAGYSHQQQQPYQHAAHYGGGGAVSAAATNAQAGIYSVAVPQQHHGQGMSAMDAVKEKRFRGNESGIVAGGSGGASRLGATSASASGNGVGSSRAGGGAAFGAQQGGGYYATGQDEYGMAALQQQQQQARGAAKRKQEEMAGANKRRKKGAADSPDLAARALPLSNATSRPPRRQGSTSTRAEDPPSPQPQYLPMEDEFEPLEGEDEQDKTLYCFCQRVSFGEMIACDAPDCEHEWFHLPCVGLKSIPEGRWFCDECRRISKAGKKGRR